MFLSFSSISGSGAEYKPTDDGYTLISYKSSETDTILRADFILNEQNEADFSSHVTRIGKYTLCCDEYVEYIYIGKYVREIETNAFYYSKNLKGIFVDKENENYASVDGVLYKKENGVLTEIVLYPMMNSYYRTALSMGYTAPDTYEEAKRFANEIQNNKERIEEKYAESEISFIIPDSVIKISDLCFNSCFDIKTIEIPSGLKEIGSMAFFRCESLKSVNLPDGLEKIGSDAFTKCFSLSYMYIPSTVTEIGHHAFFECNGLNELNLGHEDESGLTSGENWIPQKREILMKDIPVIYGQERGE